MRKRRGAITLALLLPMAASGSDGSNGSGAGGNAGGSGGTSSGTGGNTIDPDLCVAAALEEGGLTSPSSEVTALAVSGLAGFDDIRDVAVTSDQRRWAIGDRVDGAVTTLWYGGLGVAPAPSPMAVHGVAVIPTQTLILIPIRNQPRPHPA